MDDAMVTSRMSKGKKELGGAALEKLGVTPSAAINRLYDHVIATGELPFESEDKRKRGRLSSKSISEARKWLDGIALPKDNRFSVMSDDDIRRERLSGRGAM